MISANIKCSQSTHTYLLGGLLFVYT